MSINKNYSYILPLLFLGAAISGFIAGGFLGPLWQNSSFLPVAGFIKLLGSLFMNMLKIVVVPFIVTSMILGVSSVKNKENLGLTFKYSFVYYMTTTIIAVIIGLFVVHILQPGSVSGVEKFSAAGNQVTAIRWYDALYTTILSLVPSNIVMAAAKGEILGLISFSLVLGFILKLIGDKGRPVLDFTESLNEALMVLIRWIVLIAPIGIFAIICENAAISGGWGKIFSQLHALGKYFVTVCVGLIVHGIIILPVLLAIIGRKNPIQHVKQFSESLIMAFSTASSAAALPLTISNSIKNAKYSESTSRFVLPLGATINMDGTALYEAVAVVFVAQSFGIDLSFAQIAIIALTSTLAAIGAAAIPHAGLVTMVMVFSAADIPPEIASKGIAAILAVDWLLDRFRTTVNVWGDTIGCAIVDRFVNKNEKRISEK